MEDKLRCAWFGDDQLMMQYHDFEWGKPLHEDVKLFEFLILEGFQAGLSWKTVLHKRENFRAAFDNFNPQKIADYNPKKIEELLGNKGIIRNRLKIKAAINNAAAFLKLQKKYGSFDAYIWQFVEYEPIINYYELPSDIPARTSVSDKMSKSLVSEGFSFVGSTICYAFMQATGMVNNHLISCFRHAELG